MEALADRVTPVAIASVKLLNPVPNPSKVIGAPVNYHAHIDEANADAQISFGKTIKTIDHYGVFLKSNSSLSGPSEPVAVVEKERRTDHEVELAAIIGETCFDVPEAGALKYIAGYSIGLDMTIRGPEERSLRKSLDRFSVVGPYFVTADEIPDPENLDLEILVNGVSAAEIEHVAADFQRGEARLLLFEFLHALSRRHHHDRHAGRRRPGAGGRRDACQDREGRRNDGAGGTPYRAIAAAGTDGLAAVIPDVRNWSRPMTARRPE